MHSAQDWASQAPRAPAHNDRRVQGAPGCLHSPTTQQRDIGRNRAAQFISTFCCTTVLAQQSRNVYLLDICAAIKIVIIAQPQHKQHLFQPFSSNSLADGCPSLAVRVEGVLKACFHESKLSLHGSSLKNPYPVICNTGRERRKVFCVAALPIILRDCSFLWSKLL